MSKHFRWINLHAKLAAVLGLSITVILLNIAAYKHAHAMLNFAQVGERTASPEALSLWQKIKILLKSRYSGFKHNPVEYAPYVQCPVLMLHGTHDPRATIKEGMAVFQSLGGKKQFEAFAGVGHEAYLAAKPQQWQYAVAQFLVQLGGKGSEVRGQGSGIRIFD